MANLEFTNRRMGQSYGKAKIHAIAVPFASLPGNVVYGLWEYFNKISEGFGIEKKRLCALFQIMELHFGDIF